MPDQSQFQRWRARAGASCGFLGGRVPFPPSFFLRGGRWDRAKFLFNDVFRGSGVSLGRHWGG